MPIPHTQECITLIILLVRRVVHYPTLMQNPGEKRGKCFRIFKFLVLTLPTAFVGAMPGDHQHKVQWFCLSTLHGLCGRRCHKQHRLVKMHLVSSWWLCPTSKILGRTCQCTVLGRVHLVVGCPHAFHVHRTTHAQLLQNVRVTRQTFTSYWQLCTTSYHTFTIDCR